MGRNIAKVMELNNMSILISERTAACHQGCLLSLLYSVPQVYHKLLLRDKMVMDTNKNYTVRII